jgi:hypothetical protein
MVSDRSSSRPVLDGADDRRQHGACNATTGNLTDDAADIRRRGGIGKQWNQHAKDLSAGAAADGACDGVAKRTEIDVLGGASRNISADGAANDLDDQIDEHSRHNVTLPRSGVQFQRYARRRTIAAALQLKSLSRKGHAAPAKDSNKRVEIASGPIARHQSFVEAGVAHARSGRQAVDDGKSFPAGSCRNPHKKAHDMSVRRHPVRHAHRIMAEHSQGSQR